MGTSIQFISEPLYRNSFKHKFHNKRCTLKITDLKFNKVNVGRIDLVDVLILRAYVWPQIKGKLSSSSKIILLGKPSWFYCWFEVLKKYTCAYVTPFDPPNTITVSLHEILKDRHYLSPGIKLLLQADRKSRQEQVLEMELFDHLTQSELEVLALIGEGYKSSRIAEKRFRSEYTIKTQRKKARRKLGFENGERLAAFAGRKLYALKTLNLIEKNTELLNRICKNTS